MAKVRTRRPTLSLEPLEDRRLLDAGFLDPTFGTGGRVLTNFTGSLNDAALAVTRQTDGKLLVLGSTSSGAVNSASFANVALTRYNADGSLDAGFGTGGRAVTAVGFLMGTELHASMQVQADGKIIVAALTRNESSPPDVSILILARFTATGVLDTTFGAGGRLQRTTAVPSGTPGVAIQADGKILVTGQPAANPSGSTLARFLMDGTPDAGFGTGGQVTTRFSPDNNVLARTRLLTQADGKIILVGTQTGAIRNHLLIRYTSGGSLDATFGTGGIVLVNALPPISDGQFGATLQPDGKLLVASTDANNLSVVRFTTTGAFDSTFGVNGRAGAGGGRESRGITVQADGKIVVVGSLISFPLRSSGITDFAVARLNPDGSRDGSFGSGGSVYTDFDSVEDEANGVHVQPDGKLVVVGRTFSRANASDFALARYHTNGTLDTSFNDDGLVTTDFVGALNDQGRSLAVQPDGKFLVAGTISNGRTSVFALVRHLATGALDTTFGTGGRVTTAFEGQSRANAVHVQSDGKIVVAGSFSELIAFQVNRYNADGSPDNSFGFTGRSGVQFPGSREQPFFSPPAEAFGLAQQLDGKLVLVGGCGGETLLARINPDGRPDTSFGTNGVVGSCIGPGRSTVVSAARVAVLADGKLVAAIAQSGSGSGVRLRRFNADGTTDTSFGQAGFASTTLGIDLAANGPGLRILADGKILVTGSAPTTNVIQSLPGVGLAIERFNANGSIDTGFGINGRAVLDFGGRDSAADVLVQTDGKLVVVGVASDPGAPLLFNLLVTRLLPNGTVNTSFGDAGKVSVAVQSSSSPAVQAAFTFNDRLLVTGAAPGTGTDSDFFAARFTLTDTFATADERYVGQLYRNLLGRSADAGGLAAFVGLLNQGVATRAQVAQTVAGSEEYRTVSVQNLYRTLLRREADAGGLNAFVGFLRAGGTVAQVKALFLGSAEYFQNRTERTNDGFVRTVYQDVLGREPDAGGRQFFTQALNNGAARATVAGQFVGSRESLERITQGWYRQYLRRGADAGGLNAFVGFLQAGGREETAVAFFLSSGEFTAGL